MTAHPLRLETVQDPPPPLVDGVGPPPSSASDCGGEETPRPITHSESRSEYVKSGESFQSDHSITPSLRGIVSRHFAASAFAHVSCMYVSRMGMHLFAPLTLCVGAICHVPRYQVRVEEFLTGCPAPRQYSIHGRF